MSEKSSLGSSNKPEEYELSVCIPCYNEAGNIPELVDRLQAVFAHRGIAGEIVLVNDASTDRTGPVIRELAGQARNIVYLEHRTNQGIAKGWKTALKNAAGHYVCLMDADLQNLPEDVYRLYREIKFSHFDLVQGWRSHFGRQRHIRYYMSVVLNFMLNSLFSMRQKDNKSGFIVCRREVLADILNFRFKYYYFQTFITVAAHAKGYSVREVETLFDDRVVGRSFISVFPIVMPLKVLVDVIKGFFEFRLLTNKDMELETFLADNPPPRKDHELSWLRKWYFKIYILLMPFHHWVISYHAGKYYKELKESQWLPSEKIREYQLLRLKKLIRHAYNHVAYYREKFQELGITPTDINTLDDLRKLPVLTKDDIRKNLYFDFLADNQNKEEILKIFTSGSTGEPFVCFADKSQLEFRWAATLRSQEWTGYRFGDRQLRLWHQTIGMSKYQVLKEKLDAFLSRRRFIPAYQMRDENMKEIFENFSQWDPVLMDGYAESFNLLANYLSENSHLTLHSIKGVLSSAQTLTRQSRELIEKQFSCKAYDKYGSREFSGIAYECEAHNGKHVVEESFIVEIVKDGRPARPGEVGEVIITDLNNYCMPFIRYKLGDLATVVDNSFPCSCGRGLSRIGSVEGRVQAIIVGVGNQYLPGTFFAHLIKDYEYAIRQFQIIQKERGEIIFKVVKAKRYSDRILQLILEALHAHLGHEMKIKVLFVDKIPLGRTGKHQHTISQLSIDFQKEVVLHESSCSGS